MLRAFSLIITSPCQPSFRFVVYRGEYGQKGASMNTNLSLDTLLDETRVLGHLSDGNFGGTCR